MKKLCIVTGASSGIGFELALQLSNHDINVLAIARRKNLLEQLQAQNPKKVQILAADISCSEGWDKILARIKSSQVTHIVHNAATISPITPLASIELDSWEQQIATNLTAPLFITKLLLKNMSLNARILFVSSGGATNPYTGLGPYCITKAGLNMVYRCLQRELADSQKLVGCLLPGGVDTAMHKYASNVSKERFPDVDKIHSHKNSGRLLPATLSARYITWVLLHSDASFFSDNISSIRDESHWKNWDLEGEMQHYTH